LTVLGVTSRNQSSSVPPPSAGRSEHALTVGDSIKNNSK